MAVYEDEEALFGFKSTCFKVEVTSPRPQKLPLLALARTDIPSSDTACTLFQARVWLSSSEARSFVDLFTENRQNPKSL